MPTCHLVRAAILACAVALFASAAAQSVRIGAVLSQTGPFADDGRQQTAVLDAVLADWSERAPTFVDGIELAFADDGGDPLAAERWALELIEGGAHLLICCSSDAALRRVAALVEARGVLLLSPRPPTSAEGSWAVALAPSERTMLRSVVRHAFDAGRTTLGLMTLDSRFGDEVEAVLEAELAVAGMELRGIARHGAGERPLTPDALWVATREPAAVLVWSLADDAAAGFTALRTRGYSGPVYLRVGRGAPEEGPLPDGALVAVPPFLLAGEPLLEGSSAVEVGRFERVVAGRLGAGNRTPTSATMYDLATLALRSLEQVAVYGVSPTDVERFRLALRDAAIGLPTLHGAAGSYDVRDGRIEASLPEGLPVARVEGGRFSPDPPR